MPFSRHLLADVAEVGPVEQQQLLHVGALEQLAEEREKLLLLRRRELGPVLVERRPAHGVGIEERPQQADRSASFSLCDAVAVDDRARLLQRLARVLERRAPPRPHRRS